MHIRWFGHAAFLLSGERSVFLDPFGAPLESMTTRGNTFSYPAIEGVEADLLLITHEHFDHNAADRIGGDPVVIRSTAGRFKSPVGEVLAVSSEHDTVAGTLRGTNTIFAFTLDGLRICHFGDFGQAELRPDQRTALGDIDVLLLPVGGGPTIGGVAAAIIAFELAPALVIPMHYGTSRVNWLEPIDEFVSILGWDVVTASSVAQLNDLLGTTAHPRVAVLATP
ncbi:MBL fold metallo-hydrolase [Rhodococcus koreensis]